MPAITNIQAILRHVVAGSTNGFVEITVNSDSNAFYGSKYNSGGTSLSYGHHHGAIMALKALGIPIHATGLWGPGSNQGQGISTPGLSFSMTAGVNPAPEYGKETLASIASGATPTITTNNNHGLATGESVVLENTGASAVNGTKVVTVTGAKTFTITTTSSGATTNTGTFYNSKFAGFADDIPSLSGGFIQRPCFIADTAMSGSGLFNNGPTIRVSNHVPITAATVTRGGEYVSWYGWYGCNLNWQLGYLNFITGSSFTGACSLRPDVCYESGASLKTWSAIDMKSAAATQWARTNLSLLASEWTDRATTKTITSITKAAAAVVTTSASHGLSTGDLVYIKNSNSSTSIDGYQTVTNLTATTFSVPVDTSGGASAGTSGTMYVISRSLNFRYGRNLTGTSGGPGLLGYTRVTRATNIDGTTCDNGFAVNLFMWRGGGTVATGGAADVRTDSTTGYAALTSTHRDRYATELFARADAAGKRRMVIEFLDFGVNDAGASATKANYKSGMLALIQNRRAFWSAVGADVAFLIAGAQPYSMDGNTGGTGNEVREGYNRLYDTACKELAAENPDVCAFSWVDAGIDSQVISAVNGYAAGATPVSGSTIEVHMSGAGYELFHATMWGAVFNAVSQATFPNLPIRNRK